MIRLADAITRLARFRASLNDGEIVDARSGLTAADLDIIITMGAAEALDTPKPMPSGHTDPAG